MRLLLDENLSPRLVGRLGVAYEEVRHIDDAGLHGASDTDIWSFAKDHGYIIVSKDNDFRQMSALRGAPPKVVWLSVGNAGTDEIRHLLECIGPSVAAFDADVEQALLVVERAPDD